MVSDDDDVSNPVAAAQARGAASLNANDQTGEGAGNRGERRAKKKGGIERALVLDDALVSLPEEMLSKNHQIMREIIALDADGKAGLRRKYLHTVQLKDASEYLEGMLAAHMENREGPQALAKLEAVIAQPKDVMHHQLALYLKGMIIMDTTGNVGDALAALDMATTIAPTSPLAQKIREARGNLKPAGRSGKL